MTTSAAVPAPADYPDLPRSVHVRRWSGGRWSVWFPDHLVGAGIDDERNFTGAKEVDRCSLEAGTDVARHVSPGVSHVVSPGDVVHRHAAAVVEHDTVSRPSPF